MCIGNSFHLYSYLWMICICHYFKTQNIKLNFNLNFKPVMSMSILNQQETGTNSTINETIYLNDAGSLLEQGDQEILFRTYEKILKYEKIHYEESKHSHKKISFNVLSMFKSKK
eukprot:GAHX01003611.1.p1 GENE.GAHX01003611.1~~GAHX01003611.1.p1  ORF type:complete len:114 (+),score=13.01 GAHX01003611.1:186-527(+)